MVRSFALSVGLLAAVPAAAGEMSAEEARRFVIGKIFSYTCFEGTRGQGRVNSDGSVTGSIQFQGSGEVRHAHLPANTLQVKGELVCASLRGLPMQPCFNLRAHKRKQLPRIDIGAGLCLLRFHAPRRPNDRRAQRAAYADRPAAWLASLARRRQQQQLSINLSPGRSCTSWWRAHKACPRDP